MSTSKGLTEYNYDMLTQWNTVINIMQKGIY